jgi:hypothetical protein
MLEDGLIDAGENFPVTGFARIRMNRMHTSTLAVSVSTYGACRALRLYFCLTAK